ncbi:MAG: AI-2E family transporter [Cellulomonas sp.]|nr:AI-2E family transporter [Cellulomonas sp.]
MSTPTTAHKVAGARRNPSTYGAETSAPRWLLHTAGVAWRLIVVVAALALVFIAVSKVVLLFVAVFLALVFTAVLRPFVAWQSKLLPRGLATAIALLAGILVVTGLLTFVVYSIANQWNALSVQFADGLQRIIAWLESGSLPFKVTNQQVAQWIIDAEAWVQQNAGQLAGQVAAGASSAVEVFTCLALAIFCTVFFLARGSQMWTWFLNQLPARGRENMDQAAGIGWYTFSGYTRGTVLIAATDGLLAFIALEFIRVPLAAPLAVLVFIGAFIPLIGAPLAMVIAMVVALATLGPIQAAVVGVCIALIGQFEGHILQPMIMGKQVSLHPVVVALTVTAGTLTAGILGAVISVPLVAVAWAIFSRMRTMDPPLDEGTDAPDAVGSGEETAPADADVQA